MRTSGVPSLSCITVSTIMMGVPIFTFQSIYNNTGDIQYVDVRNNGAISDLPANSAVEVACRITADGPKPLATGELKLPISGYVHLMKSFERMTIEAAVTGDKNLAVAALNLNPLCPSDELANIVIDELLEAHKEYLPQFFDKSDTPM